MSELDVRVLCSVSLDGKLAPASDTSSRGFLAEIPEGLRSYFKEARADVDAVLVGNRTVAHDDPTLLAPDGDGPLRVTIDPEARLDRENTILSDTHSTLVALTEDTPDDHRRRIESSPATEAVVVGESEVDLSTLVDELLNREVESVILEGGGKLIYHFLDAELVDEFHILVIPYVVGEAGAVSLADGERSLFPDVRLDVTERDVHGSFTLLHGNVQYTP